MSAISLPGPARVVIRQHRRPLWGAGVLALAGIAALVGVILWPDSAADTFAESGCSVEHTVRGCGDIVRDFLDFELRTRQAVGYATAAMMALPAFVGLFVAGPVIGRELESGTYRLAWTQSVSPARWLAAKLAVPAVLTLAGVAVLSAVCAWARSRTKGTHYPVDWYDRALYGSIGTVPVAYALCMLALGALAGLVLRHTVAAMVTTVIGYGALATAMNMVRYDLWPTVTGTFGLDHQGGIPDGAVPVARGWLTADGNRLPEEACRSWGTDFKQCLADEGIAQRYADYHPASHLWPLQLVETGILLALAALAVLLAFRVLRRRHG
ncbi:ABC transporter permease subunit [Streptomyces sp. NPDC014646]|uniref:ABC transporter permease subunit n=1 Tax=Streptomyces sp. NPDC014646 TaxID=3364877 RepID=UPI0036F96263